MIGLEFLAFTPFDPWHMLVLGFVALLLFGKRLPEVGRSLGKGIAEFKKGLRDVQDELSRVDHEEEPPKRKLRAPDTEDESARRQFLVSGDQEQVRSEQPRQDQ